MTEVALPTISHKSDGVDEVSRSDGAIVDGMEMRIVDTDGHPLPDGVDGRLQVRGAFNFVGYLNRPDLYGTDADGWFDTGDLGRVKDGYLRITGRTKDIVIRGGERSGQRNRGPAVPPRSDRRRAQFSVAMPDERLGERACAFVTTRAKQHCSSCRKITAFLSCMRL